jgi:hypothetical protein
MESSENELDQAVESDDETSGVDAPSEEDGGGEAGETLPEPPEESEGAVPDEATEPSE